MPITLTLSGVSQAEVDSTVAAMRASAAKKLKVDAVVPLSNTISQDVTEPKWVKGPDGPTVKPVPVTFTVTTVWDAL
jgi:hypothetical protein